MMHQDSLEPAAIRFISYLVYGLQPSPRVITFYYFEACISNAGVSFENNFGIIG